LSVYAIGYFYYCKNLDWTAQNLRLDQGFSNVFVLRPILSVVFYATPLTDSLEP